MPQLRALLARAWAGAPSPVVRPVRVIGRTARLFYTDACTTYAAAIAYYAVFSLVPLALILISILGFVLERDAIVDFVFEQVPLEDTPGVRADVDRLVGRALDFSWASLSLGAITLFWSAGGVFAGVRRGLNAATSAKQHRPFWKNKLVDFALIPAVGGLLIIGVWMTAAVERLSGVGPLDLDWGFAIRAATFLTAAAFAFALFVLLYRYVPAARPSWAEAIVGAAFATVLFEVVKLLWLWVVGRILNWDEAAVYAGLGYLAVAMLWVYVSAIVLLLGAEFGRSVAAEWRQARATSLSRPAVRVEVARPG